MTMEPDKQMISELRKKTISKLDKSGIDYCKWLPLLDGEKVCKSPDQICRRFLASFFSSMLACDYCSDREFFETEGKGIVRDLISRFGVMGDLYPDESKILVGECDDQLAVDISWTVECSHALLWALGIVPTEEMESPSDGCDTGSIASYVQQFSSLSEFMESCSMRSQGEIIEMTDLYYNYHWACVDNRINPKTSCGSLDEGVVMERRKALEWLICEETDWKEISLDT